MQRKKEQERHVVTIEYSKNFDSGSNILQKKYNAMLKELDQVSISDDDQKDDQGTPGSIP